MVNDHGKTPGCSTATCMKSPLQCALDPFWSRYRRMAGREKKARRMINQAKLNSYRTSIKCKFGLKVPKNHDQAMDFDKENGNDFWAQAEVLEAWESQSLQWAVSLGRLDITTAVMTMSGFRANPREGHLERVRRIVGFLLKFKHAALQLSSRMKPSQAAASREQRTKVAEAAGIHDQSWSHCSQNSWQLVGGAKRL